MRATSASARKNGSHCHTKLPTAVMCCTVRTVRKKAASVTLMSVNQRAQVVTLPLPTTSLLDLLPGGWLLRSRHPLWCRFTNRNRPAWRCPKNTPSPLTSFTDPLTPSPFQCRPSVSFNFAPMSSFTSREGTLPSLLSFLHQSILL